MVEESPREKLEKNCRTKAAYSDVIFGAAIFFCLDWGIPVYFCGDRQTDRRFTDDYLKRCLRAINERDLGAALASPVQPL